jgi:DNA-binding MarR family transcriptional regulator
MTYDKERTYDTPDELYRRLQFMHRKLRNWLFDFYGLSGLGQHRILFMLNDREDGLASNQTEIARELDVSAPTVTSSIKALVRLEYVEKISDPNDLRINRIAITEKGREAARKCKVIFGEMDREMYRGFTKSEIDAISDFYIRMVGNVETYYDLVTSAEGNGENN